MSGFTFSVAEADEVTIPTVVGDAGAGGLVGLVPAPPAGSAAAGKFLKADGTFAVPPGSGGAPDNVTIDTLGAGGTLELKAIAANRLLGSIAGGVPGQLTPAQAKTLLAIATGDISGLGTAALLATDTDVTLAASSDARFATQKAIKAFVLASIAGALAYQGTWNAATNTPPLASGVGTAGQYYQVSVGGSTSLDGFSAWLARDLVLYNGTAWEHIEGASLAAYALLASPTFTGVVTVPALSVTGLPGAVAGGRQAGFNASGAPTTGTFLANDVVFDIAGNKFWLCAAGGTPGTWVASGGGGGGGLAVVNVTGATQAIVAGHKYINNAVCTYTLPVTGAIGDEFCIVGASGASWTLAQNALQSIHFGTKDTTVGVGGSLASTDEGDGISIICGAVNTDWYVEPGPMGNITVA